MPATKEQAYKGLKGPQNNSGTGIPLSVRAVIDGLGLRREERELRQRIEEQTAKVNNSEKICVWRFRIPKIHVCNLYTV